jgi:hypothetical protein
LLIVLIEVWLYVCKYVLYDVCVAVCVWLYFCGWLIELWLLNVVIELWLIELWLYTRPAATASSDVGLVKQLLAFGVPVFCVSPKVHVKPHGLLEMLQHAHLEQCAPGRGFETVLHSSYGSVPH